MLFKYINSKAENEALKLHLFCTLESAISRSFKKSKQRELYSIFSGFHSYNHAKPNFDSLEASQIEPDYQSHVSEVFNRAINSKETNISQLGEYLNTFIANNLGISMTDKNKIKNLHGIFFSPLTHKFSKRTEPFPLAHSEEELKPLFPSELVVISGGLGKKRPIPLCLRSNSYEGFFLFEEGDSIPNHGRFNIYANKNSFTWTQGRLSGIELIGETDNYIFVCPNAMVEHYADTLSGMYNIPRNEIACLTRKSDWKGLSKYTVIGEYTFSVLDLTDEELFKSTILYEYYVGRYGYKTKVFAKIASKLRKARHVKLLVDSFSMLASKYRETGISLTGEGGASTFAQSFAAKFYRYVFLDDNQ